MNIDNKHCLLFPTTILKVHTTVCVTTQQTENADRKGNLLQYHENMRVITRAKTVTMHLAMYDFLVFFREKKSKHIAIFLA